MPKLRSVLRAFRTMLLDYVYAPLIRVLKHPIAKELTRMLFQHAFRKLLTA